jgi:hypothetical protein
VSPAEPHEVVVEPDGSIHIPPDQVARLGLRPGEHLRLVRGSDTGRSPRRSVRGLGVGQVPPEDVLTWEDFEAARDANTKAAQAKYGS